MLRGSALQPWITIQILLLKAACEGQRGDWGTQRTEDESGDGRVGAGMSGDLGERTHGNECLGEGEMW